MLMLQENNRLLQENNRFASLSFRACVIFFIAGATAQAQTTYYSRASADWDINTTWHTTRTGGTPADSGFPAGCDTVIIQAGDTIEVDTAVSAGVVTVEDAASGNPAILDMQASGVLSVCTSVDVEDTQAVDGVFKFSATSGTTPILRANGASVTLDGPFTVTGSVGGEFDRLSTHTFQLLIGGLITSDSGPILISAPMDVEGVVRATGTNTSYLITFTASPAAGSTGRFESADNDNARMKFDAGVTWATMVTGPYFDIRKGGMTINANIGDEAGLRILDGFMIVAAGVTFTANEAFVAP